MYSLIFASFRCDPLHIHNISISLIPLEQISTQENIIAQWTSVQAELATFTFPQIGSISHFSNDTGPIIGKLSTAVADGLLNNDPFTEGWDYFRVIADARFRHSCTNDAANYEGSYYFKLGLFVFKDIVRSTALFKTGGEPFHFNHIDMGNQNILIDKDFNFLAIIDSRSLAWPRYGRGN